MTDFDGVGCGGGGPKIVPMADFQGKSSRGAKNQKENGAARVYAKSRATKQSSLCLTGSYCLHFRALCTKTVLIKNFPQPGEMEPSQQ